MLENSLLLKAKTIPNKVGVYLFLKINLFYILVNLHVLDPVCFLILIHLQKKCSLLRSNDLSFLVDSEKDAFF